MTKYAVSSGDSIELTATGTVTGGEIHIEQEAVLFADKTLATGEKGTMFVRGVFSVPKAAESIAQGDALYWNTTNKNLTKTASGNWLAGHAASAAASGDARVDLNLNDSAVVAAEA